MRNSRKILLLSIFIQFSITQYGQIIADHTVVDKYDKIPQQWIDSVKTMLVTAAGMSHAKGFYNGAALLEAIDSRFRVYATLDIQPLPLASDTALRLCRPWMTGETIWTSPSGIASAKTSQIRYAANNPYNAYIFGWSYQATWTDPPGGTIDPVYNVRWAGQTDGGTDGNKRWGLDAGDSILTGNRVCVDTYLNAWEEFIDYCDVNYPTTNMVFSTLIVDGHAGTEEGFQRELKSQHIRNYVNGKEGYLLFDYADILIYNNEGEHFTASWNDGGNLRVHDQIHPDNLLDYDAAWNIIPFSDTDGDHIGEVGALRLGKAMWWMLARMAGWDGNTGDPDTTPPSVPTGLSVTSYSLTSVSLSWNSSTDNTGVKRYDIFRDGIFLASTTFLNYMDSTVNPCNSYSYSILAVDEADNKSANSSEINANTNIQIPTATLIHPTCTNTTGTISVTSPIGSEIEYSINTGMTWMSSPIFSGLEANKSYTIHTRNPSTDPNCVSSADFIISPIPETPSAPVVLTSTPNNICPATTINLSTLVTSSTPVGGAVLFKTTDNPLGIEVSNPLSVGGGTYYVFYQNNSGCFSTGTIVNVSITNCLIPDVTPTLIVSPNIMHGLTDFDLTVKVTELNGINTNGSITVMIPKDSKWILTNGFVPSLTILGSTILNNNIWTYSSDAVNHIFTTFSVIPANGFSVFGFMVTFDPGNTKGLSTITSQIASGGGGETHVSNNSDSERIDFFQE